MHPAEAWDAITVVASVIISDLSFMMFSIMLTYRRRVTSKKIPNFNKNFINA